MAGFLSENNVPRNPLAKLGCSGLDATNHTDVLAYLLGFPIVHPDKEREQLIGDIIKLINPIQSISPEYKELVYLQGLSRKTLLNIKLLGNSLLKASFIKSDFSNAVHQLSGILEGKSKTKKGGSTGKRTTRRI